MQLRVIAIFAILLGSIPALADDQQLDDATALLATYFADPSIEKVHIVQSATIEVLRSGFVSRDKLQKAQALREFEGWPLQDEESLEVAPGGLLEQQRVNAVRAGLGPVRWLGERTPTVLMEAESVDGAVANAGLRVVEGRSILENSHWLFVVVFVDEHPTALLFWRAPGTAWVQLQEPPKDWLQERVWSGESADDAVRSAQMFDLWELCREEDDFECTNRLGEEHAGRLARSPDTGPQVGQRSEREHAVTEPIEHAPPALASAQPGCKRNHETVTDRAQPLPISRTNPDLPRPDVSRLASKTDRVAVEFTVDACGEVRSPRILASSDESLNASVLRSVREWVYSPAVRDGVGIPTIQRAAFQIDREVRQAR